MQGFVGRLITRFRSCNSLVSRFVLRVLFFVKIEIAIHGGLLLVRLNKVFFVSACSEDAINDFLLFQVILHLDLFLAYVIDLLKVN